MNKKMEFPTESNIEGDPIVLPKFEEQPWFEVVATSDENPRPNETAPNLQLAEIDGFYGVNEETVIIPYQPDFLFRQSNSRNPHLKLLYLFNSLDSERTMQIENTIKEFFKDDKSATVYFLPMGIVISDGQKTLLLSI